MSEVVVTGATSLIGHFLLPRLADSGHTINAVSRRPPALNHESLPCQWRQVDISTSPLPAPAYPGYTLIHLAPVWLLPALLDRSTDSLPSRIIAFSSTSRITKEASENDHERVIARRLAEGEDRTSAFAEKHAIPWTILRPTLIYGAGRDKNVSVIAKFIQRFGFFPLVGNCTGKRMPVHADDLAQACLSSLEHPKSHGGVYNLTGGETLSYREMVDRIFAALGKKPRYIRIPLWSLQTLLAAASLLPRYAHLTPEMAVRTQTDLVFDSSKAAVEFDYHPRVFKPGLNDVISNR